MKNELAQKSKVGNGSAAERMLQDALEHHQTGDIAAAEELYREVLRAEPQQADALHYMGVLAYQAGDIPTALENLRQSVSVRPKSPEFHNNLGLVLQTANLLADAEDHYRNAISLNPRYAEAYNGLGSVLASQGNEEEAIIAYRMAIELKPDYMESANNLGSAFIAQGKFQEAIEQLETALRLTPDYADANNNLGIALTELGDTASAADAFRKAIEAQPNLAEAHGNLANLLCRQRDFEQSEALYRRTIQLQPNRLDAYLNLGQMLLETGKWDEAVKAYQDALVVLPDSADLYSRLGYVFYRMGRLQAAEQAYEKALSLQADHVDATQNFGYILNKLGRSDEAIPHLRKAIQQDHTFRETLSICLARTRKKAKLSDYSDCLTESDLGKQIFVCCFPKSGSSFVKYVMMNLTKYAEIAVYIGGSQNEQEIDLANIIHFAKADAVAQVHCRATEPNLQILQAFNIDPVVLVRNLYDSIVSMTDYIDRGLDNLVFFSGDFRGWDRNTKVDAVIAKYAHWYVEFFASWYRVIEEKRLRCHWLLYEDVMTDKVSSVSNICGFLDIEATENEIRDAIELTDNDKGATLYNKGVGGRGMQELTQPQIDRIKSLTKYYGDVDFSKIGLE